MNSLCLLALLVPALAEAPEAIEARLKASDAALARIRGEESSIVAELEALERAIREAEKEVEEAESAAAEAESALIPLEAEANRSAAALREHLEELRPRLFSRYRLIRRGRGLGAEDPAEILRLSRSLDRVLAADLEKLREVRRSQRRAEKARAELESARGEALARAEQARALLEEAEAAREAQRRTLLAIRGERVLQERLEGELRAAKERLDRKLLRLEKARRGGEFAKRFGALERPVEGFVEVPFGEVVNAKFGTVTQHDGLDFRAPRGSEVRAVAKGKVVYAAWFRGYGNLVILDHGDEYHTLYAHLEAFEVELGAEVEAGQRLGRVGETGSLKGPFLYFELREDGRPVDPLPWFERGR